jgi:hypothetical protein
MVFLGAGFRSRSSRPLGSLAGLPAI